jgi:hypothetical protein
MVDSNELEDLANSKCDNCCYGLGNIVADELISIAKYLDNKDFNLVREGLHETERILESYGDMISPVTYIFLCKAHAELINGYLTEKTDYLRDLKKHNSDNNMYDEE